MHNFPDDARVWVYQSNRPFSEVETHEVNKHVETFTKQWVSHNQQLKASGTVLHNQFIVLAVDEGQVGAGGCSIDRSVAFLKELQAHYGVDLFNRMQFAYLKGDQVITLSREAFAQHYAAGEIDDSTPVFDPLVSNKGAFDSAFIKPLGSSWHKRMV